MKRILGCVPVLCLMISGTASAYDINAYAVSNFRPCGAGNLPATIREMDRFFASENFPEDARQNYLWTDSEVVQQDWAADTDAYPSEITANGAAGVDSALLAYIASHGVTSSGVYSAISGNSSQGGCYMSTDDMYMGDQTARYTILSTCQGLKIGSGSNPSRPGEDPSETWANSAPGLNCIMGYSNNMVDADGYGEYLLENMASGDETLAEAFFNASRQVSYSNIPVTMCFGTDEDQARYHLENMTRFTSDRVGGDVSVWSYRSTRKILTAFKTGTVAQTLYMSFPAEQLRSKSDDMKLDAKLGKLTYRATSSANPTLATQLTDEAVIEIAKTFIVNNGFALEDWGLVPTHIIDKGTKVNGTKIITEKMVVLHQSIGGTIALGTAGSFEVNVDALGNINAATFAPRKMTLAKTGRSIEYTDMNAAQMTAINNLKMQHPAANLKTVNTNIGFDTGSYMESQSQTRTVMEVEVEVEEGGLARVYVERIHL